MILANVFWVDWSRSARNQKPWYQIITTLWNNIKLNILFVCFKIFLSHNFVNNKQLIKQVKKRFVRCIYNIHWFFFYEHLPVVVQWERKKKYKLAITSRVAIAISTTFSYFIKKYIFKNKNDFSSLDVFVCFHLGLFCSIRWIV